MRAIYFQREKWVQAETLGHSHLEHKNSFGVEVLDTRPPS